jgi:hypothetical protein
MASESSCPFCHAPVKVCRSVGGIAKHTLMGVSIIAGASFVSACPAYGAPMPPLMTPQPSEAPSSVPTAPAPSQSPQ